MIDSIKRNSVRWSTAKASTATYNEATKLDGIIYSFMRSDKKMEGIQREGETLYSATTATAGNVAATPSQVKAPSHRRCRTLLI
jgi:hypothetical protein